MARRRPSLSRLTHRNPRLNEAGAPRPRRRSHLEVLETRCVFAAPTLAAIGNQTVLAGAPLMLALDGFDADGDTITYTVTSDNGSITPVVSPASNRSLRIEVAGFGVMEFKLFEDLTPRTTQHIIELANSGFYDGVTFHRIVPGFVIQGGDPTGTGSGGSPLGQFDDEFNLLLQHTSKGVLSMAKTTDDTNDSQFFITAAPTRHLDFNHSIFGFLTKGEDVRAAIDANGSKTPGDGKPPIVMTNVEVFTDTENSVLRIAAPHGFTGSGNITVTANDGKGGIATRTFAVNVVADTVANSNGSPFLGEIEDVNTIPGTAVTIPVPAFDVEDDPIQYSVVSSNVAVTAVFNNVVVVPEGQTATSNLTITPAAGFTGTVDITITVRGVGSNITDNQTIRVTVAPAPAPTNIQLLSDTGSSGSDNVTQLNNSAGSPLTFRVNGALNGAVVKLFSDGVEIGQATSNGTFVDISTNQTATLADGSRAITATQTFNGSTSIASPTLNITVDSVSPAITSTAPATIAAGQAYSYQVEIAAGTGGAPFFELTSAPAGMFIDPDTGLISWIPNASQTGNVNATVRVTDLAGNVGAQSFPVTVTNSPPVLAAISDQRVEEFEQFLLNINANDPNLPADQLLFDLLDGPAGAMIDEATGVFSFTPSELQGGGTFNVTVRVTDAAGESATETFAIQVDEVFQAPVIAPIGPQTAQVGEPYTLQVNATDSDLPAEELTFSLDAGGPPGATIDPATGLISWTLAAEDEFKTFAVTVRVTDENGQSDSASFNISVNAPPRLNDIADATIDEGSSLVFGVTSTHNLPVQYFLEPGAPAGATIDANSGLFFWSPSEAQGPGVFEITVRVTDSAGLSDFATFTVTVEEVNTAPVFSSIGDSFVSPGGTVAFPISATDSDLPANSLTYSLEASSADGASIDATTGLFTFTPAVDLPEGVYAFTVRVTDDSPDAASALITFNVTVTNVGFALFGVTASDVLELEDAIDSLALDPESRIPLASESFIVPPPRVLDTGIQSGVIPEQAKPVDLELDFDVLDDGPAPFEATTPAGTRRGKGGQPRTTYRPLTPAKTDEKPANDDAAKAAPRQGAKTDTSKEATPMLAGKDDANTDSRPPVEVAGAPVLVTSSTESSAEIPAPVE